MSIRISLRRLARIGALVVALAAPRAAGAQTAGDACPTGPTALVLSGGGAKGLAHIGVLHALDSLGVRPDLVVGTSMGAVVGALYASGYSAREIDSLARALPVTHLFQAYAPRAPLALGHLQPLVVWEQGEGGFALQGATVREPAVNALVNAALLRGNLAARGSFDRLPIPFRAVAADLETRAPVVLDSGDLARAVRASFAIPLVFAPERIDGRWLTDGGLAANIPIDAARAAGARRVIVSDATGRERDGSSNPYDPLAVAGRLVDFLFEQPDDSLGPDDVRIRPAVDGFTALNFSTGTMVQLIGIGREAADSTLRRAHCLRSSRDETGAPLPTTVGALRLEGGAEPELRSLGRQLGLRTGDSLDLELVERRLHRLGESEAYESVWLAPGGAGDTASFTFQVRRRPRRVAGMGVAYDNELAGRMWVGFVDRDLLRRGVEGSAALFLGELRRELQLGLRSGYELNRPLLSPTATVRLASEAVRRFDREGDETERFRLREAVAFAGVERTFARGWLVALGAEGRTWHELESDVKASALGARAWVTRVAPSAERQVLLEGIWTDEYRRAQLELGATFRHRALRLRPRLRLGWGETLPPHLALPLGGEDGFPGIHIGERRGDREAMADLMLTHPLLGPVLLNVEGAVGRAAAGGPLLDRKGWLAGVRAGLGVDTPVGPVRFEYGIATGGREAVFVRLGRWF
jgi:NTE family protein